MDSELVCLSRSLTEEEKGKKNDPLALLLSTREYNFIEYYEQIFVSHPQLDSIQMAAYKSPCHTLGKRGGQASEEAV